MSKQRGSLIVLVAVLLFGAGLPDVRAEEDENKPAKHDAPPVVFAEGTAASEAPAVPRTGGVKGSTPVLPPSFGRAADSGTADSSANSPTPQVPLAVAPSQVGLPVMGGPSIHPVAMLPAAVPQTGWAPPAAGPYMAPHGQAPYGQAPYGQAPYGQAPYGQAPYGQAPYGQAPHGQAPYGQAPYGQAPNMAMAGQPMGYGVNPAAFFEGPAAPPQPFAPQQAWPVPGDYGDYGGIKTAGHCGGRQCGSAGCGDCNSACCAYCGGGGCPHCWGAGVSGGYLARLLGWILPFSEGGRCAPRWYDVTADIVYLRREEVSRTVDFTSDGILGDIVLSTDSMAFNREGGLHFTAAAQVFAGGNVEFTYLGLANWTTNASVTDTNDELYSVISQYGAINTPFGFDETDRARFHSISYSSSIDSFEIHYRKRWTGPNCRLQGSWLCGVRYVYLLEDFDHHTLGGDLDPDPAVFESRGQMDYSIRTHNSLTGAQLGGDIWTSVVPGISFGGEAKAGVYGNYAQQNTSIIATTTAPAQTNTLSEHDNGSDLALIGEASLQLIYRTSPNWTIRGGYSFVYLDGVALAPENFNSTVPFSTARVLQPVNHNGSILLHGLSAGLEWMW